MGRAGISISRLGGRTRCADPDGEKLMAAIMQSCVSIPVPHG
jgi:hypothetical protein